MWYGGKGPRFNNKNNRIYVCVVLLGNANKGLMTRLKMDLLRMINFVNAKRMDLKTEK